MGGRGAGGGMEHVEVVTFLTFSFSETLKKTGPFERAYPRGMKMKLLWSEIWTAKGCQREGFGHARNFSLLLDDKNGRVNGLIFNIARSAHRYTRIYTGLGIGLGQAVQQDMITLTNSSLRLQLRQYRILCEVSTHTVQRQTSGGYYCTITICRRRLKYTEW